MSVLQGVLFVSWAVVGTALVLLRDPLRQTILSGVLGLIVALAFFSVQAPDVALSALVVGTVALPVMLLLAIAKVREQEDARAASEGGDE